MTTPSPTLIKIVPLAQAFRLADKLMVPIMFILRGLRFDSLQETHPWHVQPIDPQQIENDLTITIDGTDPSNFKPGHSFMFHAPLFGGWSNFTVFEIDKKYGPFHIGWLAYDSQTGKLKQAAVHRLPINNNQIRMLDGPASQRTSFFAVDADGKQIPLTRIASGRLNDGTFTKVRLF